MDTGQLVLVFLIASLIYFLPSIVAAGRKNNGGVLVVNLFLGWTLIGWVVALAWAFTLSQNDTNTAAIGPSGEPIALTDTKKCPFCAEDIKLAAIVCKHCGRELSS